MKDITAETRSSRRETRRKTRRFSAISLCLGGNIYVLQLTENCFICFNLKMNNQEEPAKPYRITFEHRPQYLYVYVSGDHDSYEISRLYWFEVAAECGRYDLKKVLIDEDIKETVTISEVYKLASELPQMGFQGVRVAFYDRFAEQEDLNQFGETVATNRGLIGRVFNDLHEAENWLLDRIDPNPNSTELSNNSRSIH